MKLRGLILLLLSVLSVAAAAALQNVFGQMPLCLIISATMVSAACACIVYRSFSFLESSFEKTCIRGKKFHYRFILANDTSLLFPQIRAAFFDGCTIIHKDLAAAPHQSQTIEMEFLFRHIGEYDVGFLTARIYGLFGLLFIPYNNYRHQIVVMPRIEDLDRLLNIEKDEEAKQFMSSFQKSGNMESYDGVRPYVPGDSMKGIHWKLTAHAGKYMSRLNENPESYAVSIFIDLRRPEAVEKEESLCILDRVVESALAAANYCIKRNSTVRFVFNRDGQTVTQTVTNLGLLRQAAEKFALCGYCSVIPIENLLNGFQCTRQGSLNFIVCTPNLDYDLACYIAELKYSRKNPILFYIRKNHEETSDVRKIINYLEDKEIDIRNISL